MSIHAYLGCASGIHNVKREALRGFILQLLRRIHHHLAPLFVHSYDHLAIRLSCHHRGDNTHNEREQKHLQLSRGASSGVSGCRSLFCYRLVSDGIVRACVSRSVSAAACVKFAVERSTRTSISRPNSGRQRMTTLTVSCKRGLRLGFRSGISHESTHDYFERLPEKG